MKKYSSPRMRPVSAGTMLEAAEKFALKRAIRMFGANGQVREKRIMTIKADGTICAYADIAGPKTGAHTFTFTMRQCNERE